MSLIDLIKRSLVNVVFNPCMVAAKHTIHFLFICVFFCANSFDGEWVHGTYQGKKVCDGWIWVEDRSMCQ